MGEQYYTALSILKEASQSLSSLTMPQGRWHSPMALVLIRLALVEGNTITRTGDQEFYCRHLPLRTAGHESILRAQPQQPCYDALQVGATQERRTLDRAQLISRDLRHRQLSAGGRDAVAVLVAERKYRKLIAHRQRHKTFEAGDESALLADALTLQASLGETRRLR